MRTELYHQGSVRRIEVLVLDDGSSPARDFLTFTEGTQRKVARLDAVITRFASLPRGKFLSPEAMRMITDSDGILEFKAFQERLFFFFAPDDRVILLFGVQKKAARPRAADIARAEDMKARYLRQASASPPQNRFKR